MGSSKSSIINLPSLDKQYWHQIPFPTSPQSNHLHGAVKIYRNILTNQQVQQYSINFESSPEFDQYLESFQWRIGNQNFVNTRYIDIQKNQRWCGHQQMVKVYIERIPLRLSGIQDIPEPQNLYVLLSALEGIGKLYHYIGSFKTNQDMIAIDREGRVKVWLNTNFSKNYLYGPSYVEGISDPILGEPECEGQQAMVWNIVKMIEDNTSQQTISPLRISEYLRDHRGHLSFASAIDKIKAYAKKFNITIPKYFQSVRNIFDIQNHDYDLDSDDFSVGINQCSRRRKQINQYIDQSEILGSGKSSLENLKFPISEDSFYQKHANRAHTNLPLSLVFNSGLTTGDSTLIKARNFSQIRSRDSLNKESQIKELLQSHNIPKIMFNYSSMPVTQRQFKIVDLPENQERSYTNDKGSLNRLQRQDPIQSVSSHCHVYSDIHKSYTLDDQIIQDMLRFLKH